MNAIFVWGMARAHGGRVLLRIEDHDRQRAKPGLERALLDDLDWLGFEPDVYPTDTYRQGACKARQSERDAIYRAAIQPMIDEGLVYGCTCSRRDIDVRTARTAGGGRPLPRFCHPVENARAAQAPGADADELRYPGTCRDRAVSVTDGVGWRLRLDAGVERFVDLLQGPQVQEPARQCGDLLLRDRHGNWTYQLAVVVDDWQQEIDLVIRGMDLLESTGRQIRLARLLGRSQPPAFAHHALVMKSATQKLSKSDGDTGIAALRDRGWSAARVIGHAATLAGLWPAGEPLEAAQVPSLFDDLANIRHS